MGMERDFGNNRRHFFLGMYANYLKENNEKLFKIPTIVEKEASW